MQKKFLKDIENLGINPKKLKKLNEKIDKINKIIQYETEAYIFTLSKRLKPKVKCYGVSNRCEDGQFILFLDFDSIYKDIMYKNLDLLLKKYPNLLDVFYIARTSEEKHLKNGKIIGSYHAINFIKHTKNQINEFLNQSDVDPEYIKSFNTTAHKSNVLRLTNKYYALDGRIIKEAPVFMQTYPKIPLPKNKRIIISNKQCSIAHYKIFSHEWGINPLLPHNFDKSHIIELHEYLTIKGTPI